MYLAENLKYLRKKRALTQEQFAEQISKTRACYSLWEIGIREPDNASLIIIAEFHHKTVDQLFNEDLSETKVKAEVQCYLQYQGL